jgi:hypothetical protein
MENHQEESGSLDWKWLLGIFLLFAVILVVFGDTLTAITGIILEGCVFVYYADKGKKL